MIEKKPVSTETIRSGHSSHTRIRSLDIIRGVAIILVVLIHYPPKSDSMLYVPPPLGICSKLDTFFHTFGWTGVDLFFVLSGFLIGSLLFKELQKTGSLRVWRFLGRRAFKIWPGYFALIAYAAFRAVRHGAPAQQLLPRYWSNLLQVQNYANIGNNLVGPTWSLAVEEHFYLLLPICLLFFSRYGLKTIQARFVPAAVTIILLVTLFRTWRGFGRTTFSWRDDYALTHLRIDSLLFGVLLAHNAVFQPRTWERFLNRWKIFLIVGVLLISPMMIFPINRRFVFTIGYSLLYLGYGCILIAMLGMELSTWKGGWLINNWGAKLLATIGVYSYAIYLWHMDLAVDPVLYHAQPFLLRHLSPVSSYFAERTACLALAVFAGFCMTFLIEKPTLRLRSILLPESQKSGAMNVVLPEMQPLVSSTIKA